MIGRATALPCLGLLVLIVEQISATTTTTTMTTSTSPASAMRLRGGKGHNVNSIPRSWAPEYEGSKWEALAGKVVNVNGTDLYHYEYEVGKKKAVPAAVEKFKRDLRKWGVPEERIATAKDKPRLLERMLDETKWVFDMFKKRGMIPKGLVPIGLEEGRANATRNMARAKEKKLKKLKKEVAPLLKGKASEWFDVIEEVEEEEEEEDGDDDAPAPKKKESERRGIKGGDRRKGEGGGGGGAGGKMQESREEAADEEAEGERVKSKKRNREEDGEGGREGVVCADDVLPGKKKGKGSVSSGGGDVLKDGATEAGGMAKKARKGLNKENEVLGESSRHRPKSMRGGGGEGGEGGGGRGGSEHQEEENRRNGGSGGGGEEEKGKQGADVEDADTLCKKGSELFEEGGDLDDAEAYYEAALKLDPSHVDTLCNYALLLETAPDEERGKEQEEADLSKAEGMYEKAVSLMPNDVDVLYQHALFLKERRLDYDGAEGLFQRILDIEPLEATTLCNYGVLLHRVRQNVTAAEAMYKKVMSLDPGLLSDEEMVGVTYNYAQLCETQSRLVQAKQLYETALSVSPADAVTRGGYALLLQNRFRNSSAAEEEYKTAMKLDPTEVRVVTNYALMLQVAERDEEAQNMFQRAVDMSPDEPDCMCNLAQFLHVRLRQHKAARKMYRKALRCDPDHVQSLVNLGTLIGKHKGNYSEAQRLFERALDIDEECEDAKVGYMQCVSALEGALVQDDFDDRGDWGGEEEEEQLAMEDTDEVLEFKKGLGFRGEAMDGGGGAGREGVSGGGVAGGEVEQGSCVA